MKSNKTTGEVITEVGVKMTQFNVHRSTVEVFQMRVEIFRKAQSHKRDEE